DLVDDGDPLKLLILCDTSASMDPQSRRQQAEFIAAVLSSLDKEDQFNLATIDVDCNWGFEKAVQATGKNVTAARAHLGRQRSLGWSDLENAFAEVIEQCDDRTHVIYVGDGVATTSAKDDPAALAVTLKQLHSKEHKGTFHAVAVSSLFDSTVLAAIGSLGAGSVRRVADRQDVYPVAKDLLKEITKPGLRDLKIEFSGIRVAKVYPEKLPNLAPGTQQIVLARYLPEGGDQSGELVVTGKQGSKDVSYRIPISIKAAVEGNSFIPRLWARKHLDHLLQQGGGPEIRDEVIQLSERFHIMTPYTSLLVLESDADRERFKVKRRFEMRDGQRYFADGRSDAKFQLLQQYMRLAGNWRIELRDSVLKELSLWGKMPVVSSRGMDRGRSQLFSNYDGFARGFEAADHWGVEKEDGEFARSTHLWDVDVDWFGNTRRFNGDGDEWNENLGGTTMSLDVEPFFVQKGDDEDDRFYHSNSDGLTSLSRWHRGGRYRGNSARQLTFSGLTKRRFELGRDFVNTPVVASSNWLRNFAPTLSTAVDAAGTGNDTWSPEAIELSDRVLRANWLHQLRKPLSRVVVQENVNLSTGKIESRSQTELLYDKNRWLLRRMSPVSGTGVEWCEESTRGILRVATGLGKKRAAKSSDQLAHSVSWDGHVVVSIANTFASYEARVEKKDDKTSILRLRQKANLDGTVDVVIDIEKDIVLEIVHMTKGVESYHVAFSDPVKFGGKWWTTKKEVLDRQGRVSQRVTRTLELPADAHVATIWNRHTEDLQKMVLLSQPNVSVSAARNAIATGADKLDHHMTMLSLYLGIQNPEKGRKELEKVRQLAGDKYGTKWLTAVAMRGMRRNEFAREEIRAQIQQLKSVCSKLDLKGNDFGSIVVDDVLVGTGDLLARRDLIVREFSKNLYQEEQLSFLRSIKPLYESLPDYHRGGLLYDQQRINTLQRIGYHDQARQIRIAIAKRYPDDLTLQLNAANSWASLYKHDTAYALLKRELAKRDNAGDLDDRRRIRDAWLDLVRGSEDYEQVVKLYEAWPKEELATSRLHGVYLKALLRLEKDDVYWQRVEEWVDEVCAFDGKLPIYLSSKALNVGQELLVSRIRDPNRGLDDRTLVLLAKLARRFASSETDHSIAAAVIQSNRFAHTTSAARLRTEFSKQIDDEVGTLDIDTMLRLLRWCLADSDAVKLSYWAKITPKLMKRWEATKGADRRRIGDVVWVALEGRAERSEQLDFLRKRFETAPEIHRRLAHQQLFSQLQSEPWSEEVEQELFDLLDALVKLGELDGYRDAIYHHFQNLAQSMFSLRANHLRTKITEIKDLTKTELAEKQAEALSQARREFAGRLSKEAKRQHDLLKPWILLEEAYYRALEKEYDRAAEISWSLLDKADADAVKNQRATLEHRCMAMLCRIATLESTDEESRSRFGKYVDQRIVDSEKKLAANDDDLENLVYQRERWRNWKYRLLIALDEPQVLVEQLEDWTRATDVVVQNNWRIALGQIRAEQGRISDGIKLFELAEAETDLTGSELQTLAKWHLIVNAREAYERTQRQSYDAMAVNSLQAHIDRTRKSWGHTPPPTLDDETVWAMQSLFKKATSSGIYSSRFRGLYEASKDFRLPASTANSLIGQSSPGVYSCLKRLRESMVSVNEEATVDEMLKRASQVRVMAETAVDQRALDLFELLAARRAAEIVDQPGQHIDRATAALNNAFKHKWDAGELHLYADFLSSLGVIQQKELTDIQLSQFRKLYALSKPKSRERLIVAQYWTLTLWNYGRHDEAIERKRVSLEEFMQGNDGQLTHNMMSLAASLADWYETQNHFRESESYLQSMIEVHDSPVMKRFFHNRLYLCYGGALRKKATVAIGSGEALYTELQQKLRQEVRRDTNSRASFVEHLCAAYRAGSELKYSRAKLDLIDFSAEFFELSNVYSKSTQNMVRSIGSTLNSVVSHSAAVEFLVGSLEREPFSMHYLKDNGWLYLGDYLGRYR
ncbi:MAG: hypothetical protein ACI9G1_002593, partial [Pirellulaceae bacterium]